jgi:hypothetical protein
MLAVHRIWVRVLCVKSIVVFFPFFFPDVDELVELKDGVILV